MFMMKSTEEKRMQVELQELFLKKNNFLKITPSINLFYILFKHYVRLAFFSVAGHSEPQHAGNRHHSCAFSACQS